jgi:hypothetical protein
MEEQFEAYPEQEYSVVHVQPDTPQHELLEYCDSWTPLPNTSPRRT